MLIYTRNLAGKRKTQNPNKPLQSGIRTDIDGETRYYMNGVPTYAGLMLINGDYYYFNSSKKAVRNCTYTVTKTNDLLPEGEYTFDADGKMVQTSAVMTMAATSSYQVWAPNTTTTYNYVYNGDKLSQLTVGAESLTFTYDASGSPLSVIYDDTADTAAGTTYYYVTNIQGDVIAIVNDSGTAVVEYTFDAWGNPIGEVSGTMASTLGVTNPLRYRGYVFDSETQYYYLQSRYYDPEVGRFLNADALSSTDKGILGNNMFAYCNNNPIIFTDPSGETLLSAMIGGAIGGALISVVSHITTNPNATVGSTLIALAVGAVTGTLGGVAGVVKSLKAVASIGAGLIAGVYAGITAEGSTGQRIAAGVATAAITAVSTYACASIKIPKYTTRFANGVANYSTTVLVGSVAEPVAVATQRIITTNKQRNTTNSQRSNTTNRWDWARRKQAALLGI